MNLRNLLTRWFRLLLFGLGGLALGGAPLAPAAAITDVNVGDDFFMPSSVTINVNDQVRWSWIGALSHSSTSTTPGLWDSMVHTNPFTFLHTFASTGTFPYRCSVHFLIQTGTVTVQPPPNAPPTVTITNPANGVVLSAPASFTLAAKASDSDGSVTSVEFLQSTTSLGNVSTLPYSVPVSSLAAGSYTFSAVATDNGGLKATNSITLNVVTPTAVVLGSPQRLSNTSFQFTYTANPGLRYVVQRSASSPTWTPLGTNTAASSPVTFLDNGATGPFNVYSVKLLPNP